MAFQQQKEHISTNKVGYIETKRWSKTGQIPKCIITPIIPEPKQVSVEYLKNWNDWSSRILKNEKRDILFIRIDTNSKLSKVEQELKIESIIDENTGVWDETKRIGLLFDKLLEESDDGVYLINFDGKDWEHIYIKFVIKKNQKFRLNALMKEKHYKKLPIEMIYFYQNCMVFMGQSFLRDLKLDPQIDSVNFLLIKIYISLL